MRHIALLLLATFFYFSSEAQEKIPPYIPGARQIIISDSLRIAENYEAALNALNMVHAGDTSYFDVQLKKSSTLFDLERYDEGIEVCRINKAADINGSGRIFGLNLGFGLSKKEEHAAAVDEYRSLTKQYPLYRSASNNLAYQYLEVQKYDSSYMAFKNQALLYPFDVNAHFNLGVFALNEGHFTEAFLALNMVVLLDPYADRAIRVLNLLNELSNNTKMERSPKTGFKLESNEFKDIDLLVENYVALKKGYKAETEVDIYLAKQNHLIFSMLKEKPSSDYFFNSYYTPFYTSVLKEGKFNSMQMFLLIPSENENHKKLVAKKLKDLQAFNDWMRAKWLDLHDVLTLDFGGFKGQYRAYYYSDGDIQMLSSVINGDKTIVDGPKSYFYTLGRIKAEGNLVAGKKEGLWKYYYANGQLKESSTEKNGILQDSILLYHKNGEIQERAIFKDGARNGAGIDYYETGRPKIKAIYVDNKYNGEVKSFFKNGVMEYLIDYQAGEINGNLEEYYADGSLYRKEQYKAGLAFGDYKIYWPDGKPRVESTSVNGKFDGPYVKYYFNGNKEVEGTYSQGVQVGEWKSYYADSKLETVYGFNSKGLLTGNYKGYDLDGAPLYEMEYSDNYLVKFKYFKKNGEILAEGGHKKNAFDLQIYYHNRVLKSEGKYQFGKGKIGERKEYDAYGNLFQTNVYKDNELNGECKEYHPWGAVSRIRNYQESKLQGYYARYASNGQLTNQGYYKNGNLAGLWYIYNKDGSIDSEEFYIDDELCGPQNHYAVNGKLKYVEDYEDGVLCGATYVDSIGSTVNSFYWPNKEGTYQRLHFNGQPGFTGQYILGEANGLFQWHSYKGQLESEGQYTDGQKTGSWKWYHDNGALETEGKYLNDNSHSDWKYFYDDGKKKEDNSFVYGDRQGANIDFYPNGNRKQIIEYSHDEIDGIYGFYDDTGTLELARVYRDGIIEAYYYLGENGDTIRVALQNGSGEVEGKYPNGKPSRSFNIVNSQFQGPYKAYHSNGTLILDYTLVNDERHGVYKEFYTDGTPRKVATYHHGDLHGVYEEFHPNGKKKKVTYYVNDEEHGLRRTYDEKEKLISESLYYDGYILSEK